MKPKPEQSFLHKMACRSFLVISVSLYLNDLKKIIQQPQINFFKRKRKKNKKLEVMLSCGIIHSAACK